MRQLRTHLLRKGFTFVELMIVIAIIGVLSSVVLANLHTSANKSKISATVAQLSEIRHAYELYYDKYDDYPPVGQDQCDMCYQIASSSKWASGTWKGLVDLLVADKFIGRDIEKDPWGHPYVYDKNYRVSCFSYSPICSNGPDGILQTFNCVSEPIAAGDDICIFIPNG